MSAYFRRRVLARMGLGLAATVGGVGFLAGFEAVAGHRPARREFLYELHPGRALTTAPPKLLVDTFDFVVQVPAQSLGVALKPSDFAASSSNDRTTFAVIETAYLSQVSSRTIEQPVPSVALLFDQSNSINESDPQNLRIAAGEGFVDAVPAGTRLAVFTFGEADELNPAEQPRAPFGSDAAAVKQAIWDRAGRATGDTETFTALRSVIAQMRGEPPGADRVILCFTDGKANDPGFSSQAADEAKQAGIKIWFVALGRGDYSKNEEVARTTGGGLIAAETASQLGAAFAKLAKKVVREDTSLYNLTLRAKRVGGTFAAGETLNPSVMPRSGKIAASTYSIAVNKGGVRP